MYTEFLTRAKQRFDEDLALIEQHPRQPEKVMERMAERSQLLCIADCLLEENERLDTLNEKLKVVVAEAREEAKVARSDAFWKRFDKACNEAAEKYPLADDEDDMAREQEVIDTIDTFRKRNIGMETWQVVDSVYELAGAIAELRGMVENEPLVALPAHEPDWSDAKPSLDEEEGDERQRLIKGLYEVNAALKDKAATLAEKLHAVEADLHQARIDLELQHEINKQETVRKENELMKEALRHLLMEIDRNPAYAALRPGVPASETLV